MAGHARACTEWHSTMQQVRVIGVGLSRRSQSEPTRAAFAAPPPEGARASHCRGRPTRNSGNNRTEGKDERAGNTWRDGVTGEGRKRRSRAKAAKRSGKWRGRHAQVACRVRSPREHGRHIPLYTCPFCEAAVSSSVRSGGVDHRRHCGNRFQVKDGCVVTKKMVYQCPFCDGKVSSNVMTGQVNHGSVCGSWFYVKTGRVSDTTRKHRHTCPRCQAAVWSACASGRIRVQHNTPAGRPCTQRSWKSEEKKEA